MLDSVSLDIISRFKQAVLTAKSITNDTAEISSGNRGNKLYQPSSNALEGLNSKIVEYDGVNHLVLTNESIERSNINNKRKWNDFYGQSMNNIDNDVDVDDNNDYDDDELEDINTNNNNDGHGNDNDNGTNNNNNINEEFDMADDSADDELEDHPLKRIKLAEILSPLNHPSEVVSHPSISKTYKSPIFNKLAGELIELIEVEQNNLNWLNKLLQVLNGEDWFYLLEENLGLEDYDHGLNDEKVPSSSSSSNAIATIESNEREKNVPESTTTATAEEATTASAKVTVTEKPTEPEIKSEKDVQTTSSATEDVDPFFALPQTLKKYEQYQLSMNNEDQNENGNDQELNLKQDLINYLQVSIQRQQEYIKNLSQLRNGIVRADRLKRDIYKWGKEMHDKRSS